MEESCTKENLHLMSVNEVGKSLKLTKYTPGDLSKTNRMSSSTPRQPLLDIKQVGRSVDTAVPVMLKKSSTPLGTLKPSVSQRKLKPSSLLKKPDKENEMSEKNANGNTENGLATHSMDEIFEENVEEFVTKVLDQCVQDLKEKNSINNKEITCLDSHAHFAKAKLCVDSSAENRESQMQVETDKYVGKSALHTDEIIEADVGCAHLVERHELVSQFGDLSVNEDSLLEETCYTDCSESFSESTKSEEELLASYTLSPHVSNNKTDDEHELCVPHLRSEWNKTETPRPTFLERVAVMQRVRNATSSLASWVFSKESVENHMQRAPADEKVKVVHDVACSPIPQNRHPVSGIGAFDRMHDGSISFDNIQNGGHLCDTCLDSVTSESVQCCLSSDERCKPVERVNEISSDVELGLPKVINQPVECNVSSHEMSLPCIENTSVRTVACSPISIPVCDQSVQNETETQSMMCSPIKFENLDKSIQNEAEMHSVICSPIYFHGNDVSLQTSVEMQSVMCSPILVHDHDLSVHDVSVQNQVDTHTVMCSPMVPCPSEDKSVLVSGPELTDVGIMTDVENLNDIGINVQPDMQTVGTEMDDNPMVTTFTSMTPLKLDKKQGRKLTAEDVRKQHPRVLANEFETLRLHNSRLEGQVLSLEKDRKKLVAQEELQASLEETQAACKKMESSYCKTIQELNTKQVALETEIAALKLDHENQIREVRAEYESNDYREHFLASQKLVQELQAELDEFAVIANDIEKAQKIQMELESAVSNGYGKVKLKTQWIKDQHRDIKGKREEFQIQLTGYHSDLQTLAQDKVAIEKERDQMSDIVRTCKENVLEMDLQLQKANAELGATKETVLVMREEIDIIMKEKEELKTHNEELMKQNEKLQMEVDKGYEEVKRLNSTILQQEEQLGLVNKRLDETTEKLQNDTVFYKKDQEKKVLLMTNLQRTLENRENEIDLLEKDLFECREIIYTQMEAAKSYDKKEKEMKAELQDLKRECDTLKDCCANLRAKEQGARAALKSTQEELAGIQEYASTVMKQQGTEIADCSSAINELTSHMTTVLDSLSRRAGIVDKSGEDYLDASSGQTVNTNTSQASLVSQILHAAKSFGDNNVNETVDNETGCDSSDKNVEDICPNHIDAISNEQEVVASPGDLSRKKLGFSGNSAFAPIHSKTLQAQQAENSDEAFNTVRSSNTEQSASGNDLSRKMESKFEGVCVVGKGKGLSCQMSRITELFTEITRVAHLIEKALRSSLNDVTFENEDLNSRASQFEYAERRLQAELEVTQAELEKSKKFGEELNAKLQEMGEKFESMLDQDLEMKHLQEELGRLRGKLGAVEAEKELLNGQITELLQKMERMSASGSQGMAAVDVTSQREILNLKKKLDKYRTMLNEKDKMVEQISAKATSRIQKLEANWKKADEEVCRFDELVDTIRAVLSGSKTAMEDTQIAKLIELIDGRETLSSFEMERKRGVNLNQ